MRATCLALILLLAGCAAEQAPLRVGVLVWPPYELAFLARERGYFDTDRIELVDYQTPAEVTRAYRYGLVDAFFLTSQFALPGVRALKGSRIVYVIDFSVGGDALLARPELDGLEDLAGHRVGVEASALGGYMLQRVLDFAALTRDQVELRYVDTPDHVEAYESGLVDAVITYEPYRSRILAMGAVDLFNSRRISAEIIDVLIVPESVLNAREPVLRDFVHGLERARELLVRSPDEALPVMAERERLPPATLARALEGTRLITLEENRELLGGDGPTLRALLEQQIEVMERAGLIEAPTPVNGLIDPRLVLEEPE